MTMTRLTNCVRRWLAGGSDRPDIFNRILAASYGYPSIDRTAVPDGHTVLAR